MEVARGERQVELGVEQVGEGDPPGERGGVTTLAVLAARHRQPPDVKAVAGEENVRVHALEADAALTAYEEAVAHYARALSLFETVPSQPTRHCELMLALGVCGGSVERVRELAVRAREILEKLRISNVALLVGDGTIGWRRFAPFDAILVAAGGPEVPEEAVRSHQWADLMRCVPATSDTSPSKRVYSGPRVTNT